MIKHTVSANTKECLAMNFNILRFCGIWPSQHFCSATKAFLYRCYSVFLVGVGFYLYLLTEVINVIVVFGDTDEIVKASFLMLTHAAQAVKTCNTLYQRPRIQILIDTLDDPLFNEVDPRSLPRIRSSVQTLKLITIGFLVGCSSTVLLWAIFPFLESDDDLRLPLTAWYPFDARYSPAFELVFAYQILSTLINSWCNLCQDTLISGSMGLACMQLDILHDKIADTFNIFKRPSCSTEDLQQESYIRQHLENCIDHHLKIIRFVDEIQLLFGNVVLVQFGATTFIICVTAFKLSTLPMSIELFSMVLYMLCMLAEIFFLCYFGNELIVKSELINDAAYASLWYEYSPANRKLIFMMMERSKRPLQVTAGIFTLSLRTYTSILRSSYSYFAVLQQVNADE